ncbi:MAG: bifunctional 23S rRNA (guanine(2069)-N(7))-methyltransferase RlmK/23S rRNA (guanine(2445)-N(2))-methyltransferase RlmL [Chromatiales bacterium]
MILRFFASTPKGTEALLARELRGLGAIKIRVQSAGVAFAGTLETGYSACLWSRVASRVILQLGHFPASDPEALYDGVRAIAWHEHFGLDNTFAVDLNCADSFLTHSHFGALKVKDAIVDQFRDLFGSRPTVALDRPDLRVNVYLFRNEATVSIDLSGESLHRRGYRDDALLAPLKENLAAAILLLADWPQRAAEGQPFMDLMCGSGTLPIEAALIAADIAPGLIRGHFGFLAWRGHDQALWERLQDEAQARKQEGIKNMSAIAGFDHDPRAVASARKNAQRAGVGGVIQFTRQELQAAPPKASTPGLIVVNPPYGRRAGGDSELPRLYAEIGDTLRRNFSGWDAAVFTENTKLLYRLRMVASRSVPLYNGGLECSLTLFHCSECAASPPIELSDTRPASLAGQSVQMFANRLRKNMRALVRWARRSGVECYRLYDADLPEYALAIDFYGGEESWVYAQEYAPPSTVDAFKAAARRDAALAMIPDLTGVPENRVFFKLRQRQKDRAQYTKFAEEGRFVTVNEGGYRFAVNFTDYIDTGLFLDHRATRALVKSLAAGRHFLNLFAYTGAASVYAALGGAASTTTVDLSHTYLEWARRNFNLNRIDTGAHAFIQADCLEWIQEAAQRKARQPYGLIFLDPPTFSNSKHMAGTFDVQRDHEDLIKDSLKLLSADGVLLFSTNSKHFKLRVSSPGIDIEDITQDTIPLDFARRPHVHRCWKLTCHPPVDVSTYSGSSSKVEREADERATRHTEMVGEERARKATKLYE